MVTDTSNGDKLATDWHCVQWSRSIWELLHVTETKIKHQSCGQLGMKNDYLTEFLK